MALSCHCGAEVTGRHMMDCVYYTPLLPSMGVKLPDEDPIKKIEDQHGMQSMGMMGYQVFLGALEEGATEVQAYLVMAAYFQGMWVANREDKEKDD